MDTLELDAVVRQAQKGDAPALAELAAEHGGETGPGP